METETTAQDNRQFVLSLIKEDLVNSKLIYNLNDMGIDASNYSLNLRSVIMALMGFQTVNDETHEKYTDLAMRSKDIHFTENVKLLDPLIREIYNFLDGLDRKAVRTEKPFLINKTIVTDLIKQDLINWKMINSLGIIQINADDYLLDLGRIVFEIMNVEELENVDDILDKYIEMSKPMLDMDASQSNKEVDKLASEIYDYLKKCTRKM